ncbi:uncharacterized protein N7484_011128 [Penicillium longicatenatum]|uniref:uncharacterized protein n=1 Tax=Penicillium longicatenatum TaxID=1561947 RepID=UPI002549A6A9|nr:uncharacterized protein N7484_011128 [Penicillium longicatenatum]KAJ5631028.1 hypothetical protein N7484_011128 [Penicillium longicatenatum]
MSDQKQLIHKPLIVEDGEEFYDTFVHQHDNTNSNVQHGLSSKFQSRALWEMLMEYSARGKDDATDRTNLMGGDRTRHAKPGLQSQYSEGPDQDDLSEPE